MSKALSISDLSLHIGGMEILRDIDLDLSSGEITGLIGRSGSGKSMTALAVMGLAPSSAKLSGEIRFNAENILALDERALCDMRGGEIGMIFQEPMTALNPLQSIGAQVTETILTHKNCTKAEAYSEACETLTRVGLNPEEISPERFPHELSGGQRQRVVIAIAIAMKPKVLIADEPTTALDVTTQAEILKLLRSLADDDDIATLLITHDLAVVSEIADQVAVMRDGVIIHTDTADGFYSKTDNDALREFIPASITRKKPDSDNTIIVRASNVSCDYVKKHASLFSKAETFRAVNDVSFEIRKGENLGLVGESGCGKSTLSRALLALTPLSEGEITLADETFPATETTQTRRLRRKIQIVFQDPYSSFNPRHRIADIIAEPFHLLDTPLTSAEKRGRVADLLENVGLDASAMDRFPHQFSGGQRQRIAIARALATEPDVLVFDEGTSALDIASRNHILALLEDLSEQRGVSLLLITHDLTVIRDIADRVLVMKNGQIVETGAVKDIFENPQHAYTKSLIAAAPVIRWRNTAVEGTSND